MPCTSGICARWIYKFIFQQFRRIEIDFLLRYSQLAFNQQRRVTFIWLWTMWRVYYRNKLKETDHINIHSGGYRGAQGATPPPPPPGRPNSFDFMQFSGKFGKIVCWRSWGVGAPPPRGNPGSVADSVWVIFNYFWLEILFHVEKWFTFFKLQNTIEQIRISHFPCKKFYWLY